MANRYDGIDIPDDTCRILIFDGKPFSESLVDLYEELCRPNSEATLMRTIRTVEHGTGRSVRGEKDYSVIVVVGADITRLVRDKNSRRFYVSVISAASITSAQLKAQHTLTTRRAISVGEVLETAHVRTAGAAWAYIQICLQTFLARCAAGI